MVLYQSDSYTIKGNTHTLEQLHKRHVNGETVQKMIKLSVNRMVVQETYAVIRDNVKLLVLRINIDTYFLITCLDKGMFVKNGTSKIYV